MTDFDSRRSATRPILPLDEDSETMTAQPELKQTSKRGRWAKIVVGLLVSILCLWLAVRDMLKDPEAWPKIVDAFRQANYASLPVILIVLTVFYWLKAWRWRLLLSPIGNFRPIRDLLGPIMIGFGFNNLLPMRIGEFLRCHALSKQQRIPLTLSLSSVVLERILDGMSVVFYLSIGFLFIKGLDPRVQQAAMAFSVAAACVVVVSLIFVIWTKQFVQCAERILKSLPFLPDAITQFICRTLETVAQGLASLKDVRLVFAMLVLSLVKWGLNGFIVLLSLWSFNLPHSAPIAMVLMGAIAFGVAVPSSPGYIGVIQIIFVSAMKFFTDDQEAVFASSVFYQVTQWIPVTLAGLIYGILFLSQEGKSKSERILTDEPEVGSPSVSEQP
ncbi:lysylphosphatidylglycerol synthase transmembrane domain-containing protein [Planctomicrobium sp. SH668]|uniref:lysylphosphatidylglycerol synthase transmembrane domain-containing protein n=1 Tax=Planctomicrobium sp. SH668 TaxID=3448126 RepID=UPI003F5B3A40